MVKGFNCSFEVWGFGVWDCGFRRTEVVEISLTWPARRQGYDETR